MIRFFIIAIALLMLAGCRKERFYYDSFAGSWEKAKFIGFPGTLEYPAGNGDILVLGKDGSFERKENNVTVFSGKYQLERKTDCGSTEKVWFFVSADPGLSEFLRISIADDELTLGSSSCLADGGTTVYRRLH